MLELLSALARERGAAMILVTHDARAARHADRVLAIRDGRLTSEQEPARPTMRRMIGYLRTLLLFYRRHLRVQPLRELMAILGVGAGVALLFAVQVAHHSITGSFEETAHGVAGNATLELAARGPEGFDERVAEEVQQMAGVKASAPILTQPIIAVGPTGGAHSRWWARPNRSRPCRAGSPPRSSAPAKPRGGGCCC